MAERGRSLSPITVLCCFAQFVVIMDATVIVVALPSIGATLSIDSAGITWIVNAYTLAFGGFLMLGGRAADIFGRREVFIGGLLLLGGGSFIGGAAQSEAMLIFARALQGFGAATVAPASLSILMATFVEGAERNRALGAWSAMGAVGGAFGSLVGGLLVDYTSWRWVLLVNVPVAIAIVAGALRYLEPTSERERSERRSFDFAGAATISGGMVAIIYGIVQTEHHGWGSAQTLGMFALGLILIVAFAVIESRFAKDPMIPLRMLRSRNLAGATVVVFCITGASTAMWVIVSLFGQEVRGFTALRTGLAIVPGSVSLALGARSAGWLVSRFGAGPVLVSGLLISSFGMLMFSGISPDGSYVLEMLIPIIITAGGTGLAIVPTAVLASQGMPKHLFGLASGIVNTGRQMGSAFGIAALTTVAVAEASKNKAGRSHLQALTDGYSRAFIVGSLLALLGAAIAAALLLRRPTAPSGPSEGLVGPQPDALVTSPETSAAPASR